MKAVNLLPSDRGSAKAPAAAKGSKAPASGGSPFGAYVIIGALAFAVVAMAAYVLTGNTIKDRQAQLTRVSAEAEATKAKAAALQPFADFKQLADARVSTVQGLASSRFDWELTLRDLSRALPRETHIQTLKGSTGTSVSASGASGLRSAIQSPAIEIAGCTNSQSGVARLMSRLRSVRGVTRVSLSKSDKGISVAEVAPTAATADRQAKLCKGGAAPSFELIVFFERAAVAQSAVPNGTPPTAAPAAAPTPAAGTPAAPAAATGSTPAAAPNTAAPVAPNAPSSSSTQGVSAP